MTNREDCPLKSNDEVVPVDEALASELLADLDLNAGPVASFVATSPALTAVMRKQAERELAKRKRLTLSTNPSAVEERKRYADEKGSPPRPYQPNGIEPRRVREGDFETEEDYRRRYKREFARLMRGVTAGDIEANQTTRDVTTPEEKAENRREKDRLRKAKARKAMTPEQKKAEAERKQRARKIF